MGDAARIAWVTGIGIVSCLGEGADEHWRKLMEARPSADAITHSPIVIHQLAPLDLDKQIPKKGDQRQMEPWQRIGTYAAGLALESAGLKGNAEILSRMDMIVAAGGGERDTTSDAAILTGLRDAADPAVFMNERLMNDLRPTLFLAQLPNLLAGNISIVHGVTGSSRTFMGEEMSGADAARIALARILAGQSDIAIVGGAHIADRKDQILLTELGGFNLKGTHAPVWDRAPAGGLALGSLGAFLVIEAEAHARARGAAPIARLSGVLSQRARAGDGSVKAALSRMWDSLAGNLGGNLGVVSGASGAEPATTEERAFLIERTPIPVRATGTHLGHGLEAQFVMNLALAAIAVNRGRLFAPSAAFETAMDGTLSQAIVTGVGHWRGAAMALVEAA